MKQVHELTHDELQSVTQLVRSTGLYDLDPKQAGALDNVLQVKPWETGPYSVLPCWKSTTYATAWILEPAAIAALKLRAALFAAARVPDPYADEPIEPEEMP